MLPDYDPTDPSTVPEAVRREAFAAALLAVQRVTVEHGYRLDAIAELEFLDVMLAETARRLGAEPDAH